MRLLIWGAGELGGRVAEAWPGEVLAFTLTPKRHDALRAIGAQPFASDPLDHVRPDDALLLALPGASRQRAALQALADGPSPARVVAISSTAVYGATRSGPIDESSPLGDDERARVAIATERTLAEWAGERGVSIRAGGLYRAGRGPVGALIRWGAPPPGPPDRSLALIHYDDAAAATLAALRHPSPAPIYLAVTPPSPQRGEFYTAACAAHGLAAPEFAPPTGLPPARYDVSLLRRDLLAEPAHPDWRAALQ